MTDATAVANHLGSLFAGEIMGDGAARTVASWFSASASPALTALSTTGAILDTLTSEIEREIDITHNAGGERDKVADGVALANLKHYAEYYGERAPVDGWAYIWVR